MRRKNPWQELLTDYGKEKPVSFPTLPVLPSQEYNTRLLGACLTRWGFKLSRNPVACQEGVAIPWDGLHTC